MSPNSSPVAAATASGPPMTPNRAMRRGTSPDVYIK